MGKIIISEEEKNDIRKMYGLKMIVEDVPQQTTNDVLNIDFGSIFPSGRYIIKGDNQTLLQQKLEDISKYIRRNPKGNYKIDITASESQVPNFDNEVSPPKRLATGELAKKRAEFAEVTIKNFFDSLKKKNQFQGQIEINKTPILIGKEKFDQTKDNKEDNKFTKDQFVKVKVYSSAVTPSPPQTDPFAAYAHEGETLFMNGRAYAMAFYPSRKSVDITQGGGLATSQQDVLLRILKQDTATTGEINEKGVYTGEDYKIPYGVFNKTIGTTNVLTKDMMNVFKKEGEKVNLGEKTTSKDLAK